MITYNTGRCGFEYLFQLHGSVFPYCCLISLPFSLLAVVLKVLVDENVAAEYLSMEFLSNTAAWGGFSTLVVFVIVFRVSQAYAHWWEAWHYTHQMLGEWSGAASSITTFCRGSASNPEDVDKFLQTVVRLFSMLSACALQELSDFGYHKNWGLQTLDPAAIDSESIATLDGCTMRVDLIYHWLQQLVTDNMTLGVISAPPPIVGRAFTELATGMGKFQDAMRHAKTLFPFQYAQVTGWLLVLHTVLTPLMMVKWANWVSGAFIFTFVQIYFVWALSEIARAFESPFGAMVNIDLFALQQGMNRSLLLFMESRTRKPPTIGRATFDDNEALRHRDTIHAAALAKENWELVDVGSDDGSNDSFQKDDQGNTRCCCCCKRRSPAPERAKIAVSSQYCHKRYGRVDDENTVVLAVGIFKDELVLALPPTEDLRLDRNAKLFEVPNLNGRLCQIRMKKIRISERHRLHTKKDPTWTSDSYLKFPKAYSFRQEALVKAFYDVAMDPATIPLADVTILSEQEAIQQLEEIKQGEKGEEGVAGVNIQSKEPLRSSSSLDRRPVSPPPPSRPPPIVPSEPARAAVPLGEPLGEPVSMKQAAFVGDSGRSTSSMLQDSQSFAMLPGVQVEPLHDVERGTSGT